MILKLPYIIVSVWIGQACLHNAVQFKYCHEAAMTVLAITVLFYLISFLCKKTKIFHVLIGWSWFVLPVQLFWDWIGYASVWGGGSAVVMIACSCFGVVLEWMWIHDSETKMESHGLAGLLSIWIIGGALTECIGFIFPEIMNRFANFFI